jgi:hypothetical protein
MPYSEHRVRFNPMTFAQPVDIEYLANLFAKQGVVSVFELDVRRRRNVWGVSLPYGVFDSDFTSAPTREQHIESRNRVTQLATNDQPNKRRPIAPSHDVLEHGGKLYYHPEALRIYARYVDHPGFLLALARFIEAAEKNPALVVKKKPRTVFVPISERKTRGPRWEPEEDAVLRRWFGPRTVGDKPGKHQALTEREWQIVLGELPNRNKKGCHDRMVELNRSLKQELFRNGFVSHDQLPQYMARVLGERPRIPIRPRKRRRL